MTFLTPVRLLLIYLVFAMMGLLALPYMRIDLLPGQMGKSLTVNYQTANTSPELNESRYTSMLENGLSQLTQIRHMESVSTESGGEVVIRFDAAADLKEKRFQMAMLIRQLYPKLTVGISYPTIANTTTVSKMESEAIRVYMINGPGDRSKLQKQFSPLLHKFFLAIKDIRELEIIGAPKQEISVTYNRSKCAAFHVTSTEIRQALSEQYRLTFPCMIRDDHGQKLFITIGENSPTLQSLSDAMVVNESGQAIKLAALAEISQHETLITDYYRINGQNALNVNLYPKPGSNALALSKKLDLAANEINKQLPPGYSLKLVYDKTAFLHAELQTNYKRSALAIGILLAFILVAYQSIRSTIVILSSLVVNICIGILLICLFQVNINLYTVGGVTLAFGLIIDNAIVNLDYYQRHRNLKILPAMLGANLCIITGLSIVYMLPDQESKDYNDFCAMIILSLCASLLVAVGFTPAVSSLLQNHKLNFSSHKIRRRMWRLYTIYQKCLQTLAPGKYAISAIFFVCLGIGCYLFQTHIGERSGIRNPDQTKLYLTCNLADGHTALQMNELFQPMEDYLKQQKGIDKFITYIQSGQYGGIEIFIKKDHVHGTYTAQLYDALVSRTNAIEGVKWQLWGLGKFHSTSNHQQAASYSVLLRGYHYQQLEDQAHRLRHHLQQNSRVVQVNVNAQYSMRDREMTSSSFSTNPANSRLVYNALHDYQAEIQPLLLVQNNGEYSPVYVRSGGWQERSQFEFLHDPATQDSMPFSLNQFGQLAREKVSNKIYKKDRQYLRVVSYNYQGDDQFGSQHQALAIRQFNVVMPAGFSASKYAFNFKEENKALPVWPLWLLVALNFVITCMVFENLKQPLLLISLIPLSFTGLLYVFALTDHFVDQGAYAAFLMLGCLAVNAGIFLINDYNHSSKRYFTDPYQRLARAFFARSRPIVLTIISCCCALLPFLFDGEDVIFWYSFSVGTLSGLLFSFLTLFIYLPLMLAPRYSKS
ncbi:efflux RND transporter permease subunit [Chitinophaga agri]|uniref:Efflux RND transporter permease subunit n=1 Tax=Chitinophaga agri TaxID=2703787 RepID=A0A6B9ZQ95_9BACT|nr:efflux RND transporter permease subunit [Chitinophaga agri]QHS63535.1 efflux RND transporter permease subunit [Chitinophaga agri]